MSHTFDIDMNAPRRRRPTPAATSKSASRVSVGTPPPPPPVSSSTSSPSAAPPPGNNAARISSCDDAVNDDNAPFAPFVRSLLGALPPLSSPPSPPPRRRAPARRRATTTLHAGRAHNNPGTTKITSTAAVLPTTVNTAPRSDTSDATTPVAKTNAIVCETCLPSGAIPAARFVHPNIAHRVSSSAARCEKWFIAYDPIAFTPMKSLHVMIHVFFSS
mmetsp:Transcript_5101/g.18219  ORF Transcript_5101/g.18219 Transcript_5101/m.18219 type:complete len:217 (-) Transcript_5101:3852-4502(-)